MSIYVSDTTCAEIPAVSVTDFILRHAERLADKAAMIDGPNDRVVTYDAIPGLDASQPAVMVDMAGSSQVISDVHHHYGDALKHSCRIGATHYEEMGPVEGLPGPEPEFFFAPSHLQTRSKELGAGEFMMRLGAAYVGFRQYCDSWLQVELSRGAEAVGETYQQVLAGGANPATGQMIAMNGEAP